MAIPLTEAATFDAQVIVPQDGLDDESAASLVPAFQSLANRTRSLKTVYDFSNGDASITTPTTKTLTLNGTVFDSPTDGGDLHPGGAFVGKVSVFAASGSSGSSTDIPYYAQHVYVSGFGAPVTSGHIWVVGTPPDGSDTRRWVMTLYNPNSGGDIIVKDVGGNTLATLKSLSGSVTTATIAYDGSSWIVIATVIHP